MIVKVNRQHQLRNLAKNKKATSVMVEPKEGSGSKPPFTIEELIQTLSGVRTMEKLGLKLNNSSSLQLDPKSIRTLLQCRNLKSLSLVKVEFSGQTLTLDGVQSPLEELTLVNVNRRLQEHFCLGSFLIGLASSIPSLKTVICTNNNFGSEDMAAQTLGQLLSSPTLEKLEIKHCTHVTPTCLFRPLEALKNNTTMKYLELHTYTPMTDQCIQWHGEMLEANQALRELSLKCDQANLLPISHALASNRTLTHFYIRDTGNHYIPTTQVEEAFARVLEHNCVLQKLGVEGSRWSHNIDHYLRLNRAGRQYLWNTTNAAAWVNAIIDCRHDTPIIYELISKNPSAICHLRNHNTEESSSSSSSEEEDDESSDEESDAPPRQRRRIY